MCRLFLARYHRKPTIGSLQWNGKEASKYFEFGFLLLIQLLINYFAGFHREGTIYSWSAWKLKTIFCQGENHTKAKGCQDVGGFDTPLKVDIYQDTVTEVGFSH